MGTTTSTGQTSTTVRGREKKETKTNRTLGIVPFSITPERRELREFEHVFLYGVLELLGLIGKVHTVELAPCYPEEELARRRDSGTLKDTRDLIRTADARAILTGAVDGCVDKKTLRIDSIQCRLELRQVVGRKVETVSFDVLVRNMAPREEPERFLVDTAELLAHQRDVFAGIKRALRWRYSAGKDRRKYFEYRQKNPMTRSFEAYRYFVRARRMTTSREDKLALYRRAVRHDPCLGQGYRNIGYLYKEDKKLETAVRYYLKAVELLIDGETLADAYAELGLCFANMNRVDEAIRHWHISRRWSQGNKDVYANLAIGYEEKGMIDKAIRYFSRAQNIDPEYYWACRGLGRIYAGQQDWGKAIEQLSIQLKIAPEDAWGHYTLGNCYFHEGNPDKARSHCRRAVELDPHGDAGRRAFQLLMDIEE